LIANLIAVPDDGGPNRQFITRMLGIFHVPTWASTKN
jgi:hypothetical protein